MTSLTPCQDAARRVSAEARRLDQETAEQPGSKGMAARIRLAFMEQIIVAVSAEIDNGANRRELDEALVNVVANIGASLGGMTRSGAVFDASTGNQNDELAPASLLYDAMQLAMEPGWNDPDGGVCEHVVIDRRGTSQ